MTIADYLVNCMYSGLLRNDRQGRVYGMGEFWKFIPNKVWGPGVLVNEITGNVLSVAEISDRQIDRSYNDWQVV